MGMLVHILSSRLILNKSIILLIAESGAGKDTIANKLEEQGYKILKSYATRPQRPGEGNTHIFIKPDEVEQYKNQMIAYTKIGEYEYFSTKDQLLNSDIYIIDPKGYKYLKNKIQNIKIIPIFINVKEQERYNRALKRINFNEKERQKIEDRFISEYKQFQEFRKNEEFYSVMNYDLNKAVKIVKYIIDIESGCNGE